MFIPTRREAQMIEAIADEVSKVGGRIRLGQDSAITLDADKLAEALRSLAQGGGEKLECTCNIQYISCDVHEKPQITFSPAQVDAIKKNVIMPHEDNQAEWNRGYMSALKEVYRFLDSHTSKE